MSEASLDTFMGTEICMSCFNLQVWVFACRA